MNDRNCAFKGEMFFLSNFYESKITVTITDRSGKKRDYIFQTAEHLFQACKAVHDEDFFKIAQSETPGEAKKIARTIKMRENWEEIKIDVMTGIILKKFTQNQTLKNKLIATGNIELIEENDWNDTFWGVDIKTKKGQNHLGKILMEVREELKKN